MLCALYVHSALILSGIRNAFEMNAIALNKSQTAMPNMLGKEEEMKKQKKKKKWKKMNKQI